jgi:holo-[acyl-carrier protein] synthase
MIDIRRIEQSLARFGARFENRVFTVREQMKAKTREKAGAKVVASTYAKRFAAKEACAKALGTGLRQSVFWRDMEVINRPGGAPTLLLHGGALARLEALTPEGMQAVIHLTLTDEYPFAHAQVILSAELLGPGLL